MLKFFFVGACVFFLSQFASADTYTWWYDGLKRQTQAIETCDFSSSFSESRADLMNFVFSDPRVEMVVFGADRFGWSVNVKRTTELGSADGTPKTKYDWNSIHRTKIRDLIHMDQEFGDQFYHFIVTFKRRIETH